MRRKYNSVRFHNKTRRFLIARYIHNLFPSAHCRDCVMFPCAQIPARAKFNWLPILMLDNRVKAHTFHCCR